MRSYLEKSTISEDLAAVLSPMGELAEVHQVVEQVEADQLHVLVDRRDLDVLPQAIGQLSPERPLQ